MSAIFELGAAVRVRRSDMGLTQMTLARLSGLSRATVNQVEKGTIKDLSMTRAAKLLEALGLSVTITAPRSRSNQAEGGKSHALDIAARTASVSYKVPLSPPKLRDALITGSVPKGLLPHMHALLDEAPVALLASVVEQLHREERVDRAQVWKHMRELAHDLKSSRELWQ